MSYISLYRGLKTALLRWNCKFKDFTMLVVIKSLQTTSTYTAYSISKFDRLTVAETQEDLATMPTSF